MRVSLQQRALGHMQESLASAQQGTMILKEIAQRDDAKASDLDEAVAGLTIAEPESLRDPQLAVKYGERMVEMSRRQNPDYLLDLATAYREAGELERARATARGRAQLLPDRTTHPSRTRKLLEGFD